MHFCYLNIDHQRSDYVVQYLDHATVAMHQSAISFEL